MIYLSYYIFSDLFFQYIKDDNCFAENSLVDDATKSLVCELWQLIHDEGDKRNTYSMYILKTTKEPIHYIMKGYNTLLGSHYDKYELYYMNYTEDTARDEDFEVRDGK